jgi:hypothetical protein
MKLHVDSYNRLIALVDNHKLCSIKETQDFPIVLVFFMLTLA